ncbi:MAG: hypothetical protein Q8T09_21405 [Candidatus Melainabacteria bacterium]|nr:hypothetical protein [Candidatus Melainabacteria bacterium]
MKSHAFLVGVNVAASIPLVLAPQAMASDNMSGTASFLKAAVGDKATARSLSGDFQSAPVLASKRLPIRRSLSSASLSEPHAVNSRMAMNPVAGATKLRPFVAGRKLPSRNQLQAQIPQLDNSSQPNLAGSINESTFAPPANNSYESGYGRTAYNNNASANSAYSQAAQSVSVNTNRSRMRQAAEVVASFQRKHASRSLPGQSPSTPGQVGFPCAQQAVSDVNAQPARNQNPPSEAEWTQMARNAANGSNTGTAGMTANTDNDSEMASLAQDFAASQAHSQGPIGSAGPAPFPLSLIPEASLKQLMGSTAKAAPAAGHGGASHGRSQQAMAPSYFGSWHQNQSTVAHGRSGNLQPSGFHTYLPAGSSSGSANGRVTTSSAAFKSYAPMTYKASRRVAPKFVTVAKKAAPVASAPFVATYGAYHAPAL